MKEIKTIVEFLQWVEEIYFDNKTRKHLFFRGHSSVDYRLVPSIFRELSNNDFYDEKEIFLDFKQFAPAHGVHYNYTSEKESLLADMQHHGVPTRLLDWTVAPLNALFFACESNEEKDAVVYVFNPWKYWSTIVTNKSHPEIHQIHITARTLLASKWSEEHIIRYIEERFSYKKLTCSDIQLPFAFVGTFINQRMIHQKGCFTIHGMNKSAIEDIPEAAKFLSAIKIPKDKKTIILSELNTLFINHYSVYPDFEGMTKTVRLRKGLFNL